MGEHQFSGRCSISPSLHGICILTGACCMQVVMVLEMEIIERRNPHGRALGQRLL